MLLFACPDAMLVHLQTVCFICKLSFEGCTHGTAAFQMMFVFMIILQETCMTQ